MTLTNVPSPRNPQARRQHSLTDIVLNFAGLWKRARTSFETDRDSRSALARVHALGESHGQAYARVASELILSAALARCESRGAHFRSDYPNVATPQRTFVTAAPDVAAVS